MNTNDLKKGIKVELRNGWFATIKDNRKGNTRLAEVDGVVREMGSVYSHDIVSYYSEEKDTWLPIDHTDSQHKLQAKLRKMGW